MSPTELQPAHSSRTTKQPASFASKLSSNCSASSAVSSARARRLMSLSLVSNLFHFVMIPLSIRAAMSPLISFHKSVPRTLASLLVVGYLLAAAARPVVDAQLIINLKNRGGEVYQQAISTKENFIEVEYQSTDGNLVNQIIDFENVSTSNLFRSLICIGQRAPSILLNFYFSYSAICKNFFLEKPPWNLPSWNFSLKSYPRTF